MGKALYPAANGGTARENGDHPVLLDTNVIYAALNRRDHDHDRCVAVLNRIRRPLVTCEAVICEACFLAQSQPMAVERILANVRAEFSRFHYALQIRALWFSN